VITALRGRASGAPSLRPSPTRGFRVLVLAAAAATYLLIVAGGVVRVTGSGLGCGATGQDWPLCHGRLVPPADVATVIEFSHRSLATVASVLIVAVALVALRRYRHLRRIVVPSTLVVLQLAAQILLGAATVEWKLPGGIVLVHLANALLLLAVLVWVATAVLTARDVEPGGAAAAVGSDKPSPTLARLGLIAAATTFVMVLSGGLVVANGAGYSCAGWPLCGGGLHLAGGQMAIVNLAHRGVIGVGTVVLAVVAVRAVLALRDVLAVRATVAALAALLLSQFALGIVLVETQLPTLVRGLHEAFGSAVWAVAVLLAILLQPQTLARLARRPSRDAARLQPREPAEALRPREAVS
jgi:heme A synthase